MQRDTIEKFKILLDKHRHAALSGEESALLGLILSQPDSKAVLSELTMAGFSSADQESDTTESPDFDQIYNKIITNISARRLNENRNRSFFLPGIKRIISLTAAVAAIILCILYLYNIKASGDRINSDFISDYEIRTPYGAITNIALSDGTVVTLNAGSVLIYKSSYNTSDRNLSLDGEAYFKVASNDAVPFIVEAGNINVIAKGTEFNIKAYHDDDFIEATLVEGRIEVISHDSVSGSDNSIHLLPLQKALYRKRTDSPEIKSSTDDNPGHLESAMVVDISSQSDVDQIIAWTKDLLEIKNEAIGNLSIRLERKYDVDIIFADEQTEKIRFTGTLENEPIEQVLSAIKLSAPIDYTIKGRSIIMFTDKTRYEQE